MPTLDDAVKRYMELKAELADLTKKYDERKKALEDEQDKISRWMGDVLDKMGVTSAKTQYGTALKHHSIKYSLADSAAFKQFVRDNPVYVDLLQSRLSTQAVAQYVEDNAGNLPVGVTTYASIDVVVRKS